MDKRLTKIVGYVIISAWIISFLVDLVVRSYEPPPTLHALMMLVAGAAFSTSVLKGSDESKKS